ncbi:MAG: hypothetical protein IJ573_10180 [Clostridia bacterium]|nr:hypothetical protein [Clostridia bacterium]
MAREEKRSRVRHRSGGCFGCLTRLLILLGIAAALFVGACLTGIIRNDADGRPVLSLNDAALPDFSAWSAMQTGKGGGFSLPGWAYNLDASGLTIKALRAGKGEALLVCSNGFTMLVNAGSGRYGAAIQMLLCRINRLDAVVATDSTDENLGGVPFAMSIGKPAYLFYQDTQTKSRSYEEMLASPGSAQTVVPRTGLAFNLGGARVTFIGPEQTHHKYDGDDSLSLRIDYGKTAVLITGGIGAEGERELMDSGANLAADALIFAPEGSRDPMSSAFAAAVSPKAVIATGDLSFQSKARLEQAGAHIYSTRQTGVITLVSDGETVSVEP